MMKKYLFVLAAALVTLAACNRKDPEVKTYLTLTSEEVVNLGDESAITTITFKTNKPWTAEVTQEGDFVVLNKKSGEAGDANELKATVQSLPSDELGRVAGVTIKADTEEVTVVLFQGKVFFVNPDNLGIGIEGGKCAFQVITNLEYSVKTYNDVFTWAPVTYDETTGEGEFDVAANDGYDLRSAYIKFTIPAIQDPVYDDEGNETGETQDHVVRVYVSQDGQAVIAWKKGLPADFDVANVETDAITHDATASIALFNGKLLVCDATKVYAFDPATGNASGTVTVPEALPVQSIASDDAGNLLFAPLIPYLGVGKIYAVKASDTNMASPQELIPFVNDAWAGSHGADKVAARGDVFGNGMVTMLYGGLIDYGGLTYGLNWEIKDGKAAVVAYNEWNNTTTQASNGWFTVPTLANNIWLSNRGAFVPAGPKPSDGYFYAGYDGLYHIFYYNGTEWKAILEDVGFWGAAVTSFATITWNGKKILAFVNMGYFPEWDIESQLWIVDVTNPASPDVLATTSYMADGEYITGGSEASTTSVVLQVEGNDLVAYVVDTAWGQLLKVKYPKL